MKKICLILLLLICALFISINIESTNLLIDALEGEIYPPII